MLARGSTIRKYIMCYVSKGTILSCFLIPYKYCHWDIHICTTRTGITHINITGGIIEYNTVMWFFFFFFNEQKLNRIKKSTLIRCNVTELRSAIAINFPFSVEKIEINIKHKF